MSLAKSEIVKRNMEFVYGKPKANELPDPDKVAYVKSKKALVEEDDSIANFTGEYDFLGPSYPCRVYNHPDPIPYPSFEHALQATKLDGEPENQQIVRETADIRDVKRFISKQKLSPDRTAEWNERCMIIAEKLLRDKFVRSKEMKARLMKTKGCALIYRNDYGDNFWGIDKTLSKGKSVGSSSRKYSSSGGGGGSLTTGSAGQNRLGKLLEKVRNDTIKGEDIDMWMNSCIDCVEAGKVTIEVEVAKHGVRLSEETKKTFEHRWKIFIGKSEEVCEIIGMHPSLSRCHAAVAVDKRLGPVLIDLQSANGTAICREHEAATTATTTILETAAQSAEWTRLKPFQLVPITSKTMIRFGASTRQYFFNIDTLADVKRKAALLAKISGSAAAAASSTGAGASLGVRGGGIGESITDETSVFVRHVPAQATDDDVRAFFDTCGEIVTLSVPRHKATGETKGVAFVTFSSFSGVLQAVSRDGDMLLDKYLRVKKSDSSKQRAAPPPPPPRSLLTKGGGAGGGWGWEASANSVRGEQGGGEGGRGGGVGTDRKNWGIPDTSTTTGDWGSGGGEGRSGERERGDRRVGPQSGDTGNFRGDRDFDQSGVQAVAGGARVRGEGREGEGERVQGRWGSRESTANTGTDVVFSAADTRDEWSVGSADVRGEHHNPRIADNGRGIRSRGGWGNAGRSQSPRGRGRGRRRSRSQSKNSRCGSRRGSSSTSSSSSPSSLPRRLQGEGRGKERGSENGGSEKRRGNGSDRSESSGPPRKRRQKSSSPRSRADDSAAVPRGRTRASSSRSSQSQSLRRRDGGVGDGAQQRVRGESERGVSHHRRYSSSSNSSSSSSSSSSRNSRPPANRDRHNRNISRKSSSSDNSDNSDNRDSKDSRDSSSDQSVRRKTMADRTRGPSPSLSPSPPPRERPTGGSGGGKWERERRSRSSSSSGSGSRG